MKVEELIKNWAIIPQSCDEGVFQIVYRYSQDYTNITVITLIIEEITNKDVVIWAIRWSGRCKDGIEIYKREIIPKTRFRLAKVDEPPYNFLLVRHGTYHWQLTYGFTFSLDAESINRVRIRDLLPLLEKAKIVKL